MTGGRTQGGRRRGGGPRRGDGARGLGLIELMVSVAIASVVLLGFAGNTIAVARAHGTGRNAAAATALAQQQLEALRSLPLGAPGLAPGAYTDAANPLTADGAAGGPFVRTWAVSANDTPALGLKTVTVTVTWTDYASHQTAVAAYVRCSTVPCV